MGHYRSATDYVVNKGTASSITGPSCFTRVTFLFAFATIVATATEGVYDGFVYKEFQDPERDRLLRGRFPGNFTWATATAAYQIEGGWNEDGKGESIWDTFTHEPDHIYKDQNGDVACDSYHKIDEDVAMLKKLNVTHYRFSISWPRILPEGTPSKINENGVKYYQRLIDALIGAGIEPMVTLYHWDLPQSLQDTGGWENDINSVYFNEYAEICFLRFGDRVKLWITFNEPAVVVGGYEHGGKPPGFKHQGSSIYRATHNILKAHALVWRTYDRTYREQQGGQVGITLNCDWVIPATDKEEDVLAAERYLQFQLGRFAHPLIKGDYPDVMKKQVLEKSLAQGLTSSRLPKFNEEEIQLIRGSVDFLGLNHYTTKYCAHQVSELMPPSLSADQDITAWYDQNWPKCGVGWLRPVPWGIRQLLGWMKDEYGDIPIYVTENGVAEYNENGPMLNDTWRIQYYTAYINEVLKAYQLDGVDVRGYTAWSLMDNFEWADGYKSRFGLYYVDFDDPKRPRTPKASAESFAEIVRNNGFPELDEDAHNSSPLKFISYLSFP